MYIIDEKQKMTNVIEKSVHCDIVNAVEQRAEIGERIQVIKRLLFSRAPFLKK